MEDSQQDNYGGDGELGPGRLRFSNGDAPSLISTIALVLHFLVKCDGSELISLFCLLVGSDLSLVGN